MARRKISHEQGVAAVRSVINSGALESVGGTDPETPSQAGVTRQELATATRYLLEELAVTAPGATVEVRVPPFGAVQCVSGPRHTRGTPPNTVEMDPLTWIAVATGQLEWQHAIQNTSIRVSGVRADISGILPLLRGSQLQHG